MPCSDGFSTVAVLGTVMRIGPVSAPPGATTSRTNVRSTVMNGTSPVGVLRTVVHLVLMYFVVAPAGATKVSVDTTPSVPAATADAARRRPDRFIHFPLFARFIRIVLPIGNRYK